MFRTATLSAALLIALGCPLAHGLQRAFVVSTGNDANAASGCTPALPCRSFQAAHDVVDPGGEVVALDTAGFGQVAISKSVSIIGNPGTSPSISVASGEGVYINAPGVKVTLRNLNFNGVGGDKGLSLLQGDSLTIENCVFANFAYAGVVITSHVDNPAVRIANTISRGNSYGVIVQGKSNVDISDSHLVGNEGGVGLLVWPDLGVADVAVSDTVLSGNGSGIANFSSGNATARTSLTRVTASNNAVKGLENGANGATATAILTIGSSMVANNGRAFENGAANGGVATLESLGNNMMRNNTNLSQGSSTLVPGL